MEWVCTQHAHIIHHQHVAFQSLARSFSTFVSQPGDRSRRTPCPASEVKRTGKSTTVDMDVSVIEETLRDWISWLALRTVYICNFTACSSKWLSHHFVLWTVKRLKTPEPVWCTRVGSFVSHQHYKPNATTPGFEEAYSVFSFFSHYKHQF